MNLTDEQVKRIKAILSRSLDRFPEDKRSEIKAKIDSMDASSLEKFIEENNLYHLLGGCIFCNIVSGKVVSFKVGENDDSVAVLDINPLSRAHVLVIVKKHGDAVSEKTKELVDLVKGKIKRIFNPKKIEERDLDVLGHKGVEVVPVYEGEKLERRKAEENELKDIAKKFFVDEGAERKEVLVESSEKKEGGIPKLPPRIPHGPLH